MAEYIEREALYRKICELEELARNRYLDTPSNSPAYPRYMAQLNERTALKHLVFDMPAADVVPVVHGAWDWFDEDTGSPISGYEREWGWRCSNCKTELSDDFDNPDYLPEMNFCPNCGAKMDEEDKT